MKIRKPLLMSSKTFPICESMKLRGNNILSSTNSNALANIVKYSIIYICFMVQGVK